MPVPTTKDVGKLFTWFRRDKPNWTTERVRAAALNTARANGAPIPPPKKR